MDMDGIAREIHILNWLTWSMIALIYLFLMNLSARQCIMQLAFNLYQWLHYSLPPILFMTTMVTHWIHGMLL